MRCFGCSLTSARDARLIGGLVKAHKRRGDGCWTRRYMGRLSDSPGQCVDHAPGRSLGPLESLVARCLGV